MLNYVDFPRVLHCNPFCGHIRGQHCRVDVEADHPRGQGQDHKEVGLVQLGKALLRGRGNGPEPGIEDAMALTFSPLFVLCKGPCHQPRQGRHGHDCQGRQRPPGEDIDDAYGATPPEGQLASDVTHGPHEVHLRLSLLGGNEHGQGQVGRVGVEAAEKERGIGGREADAVLVEGPEREKFKVDFSC